MYVVRAKWKAGIVTTAHCLLSIVLLATYAAADAEAQSPRCELSDFADVDLAMPRFETEDAIGFRSSVGQSGEFLVYKAAGRTVALTATYLTDESGLTLRFIPGGAKGMIVVGMVPDEPATRFTFVLCSNGGIYPRQSPSPLFTNNEFLAMARGTAGDFWTNTAIQPFRRQLME